MQNNEADSKDPIDTLYEAERRYYLVAKEYVNQYDDGHKFNQHDVQNFVEKCKKIENYIEQSSGDWDRTAKSETLTLLRRWRERDLIRLEASQINADSTELKNRVITETGREEMDTLFDEPINRIRELIEAQRYYEQN